MHARTFPRLRRGFLALSSLALAACSSTPPTADGVLAGEQPPASAAGVLLPRDDLPGLENFARVSEELYRGAQPTAEGMQELARLGIKTVVDLRSFHSDRDELRGTGLRYAHIPCKAWHPEEEDVVRF